MNRKTLLFLIVFGVFAFVGLVWLSLHLFPHFALSLLFIVSLVLLYVLTEHWITHAANEFENRFWSLIAFILTFVCCFVDDSPFCLGQKNPFLGWILVISVCFLAHNYDRHLRREKLKRGGTLKRISSATVLTPSTAKLHLQEIESALKEIDNPWFSSTFLNLFMLPRVLYIERKIISIFTEATKEELNYLVTNSHLGLLFYKMKDHNVWRIPNRTILLDTLAVNRVLELEVLSRTYVLDALQRMKVSAHEKGEFYVKNIILKTKRDELSDLKSRTDSKGDFYSLHKLIYEDLHEPKIRESILEHINSQAKVQRSHMTLGTANTGKRMSQFAWRKILSDVDDTLSCSGGSYPAGIDTSYPKKVLYPGVLAFYRELDLGQNGPEVWDPDRVGNLVFLSARPHVYKDALEHHSYELFKRLQETRGLYSSPSLLAGSLVTGGEFMVAGDMEPLALKKYENFQQYAALYAEYDFVFVGDNGQGDVRAAELISEDQKYRGNLKRVYIHEVQPLHLTHARNRAKILTKSCPFVCYFTTYVDAAIDAYRNKLIRLSGLRRIAQEAAYDFEHVPWDLFGSHPQSLDLRRPQKNVPSVPNKSKHSKSTPSMTILVKESFRRRYLRLLELNESLVAANNILVANGIKPVLLLRFQCLFPRGTAVMTNFGLGVVEKFRYHDGIYEVRLALGIRDDCSGGDFAYLRSDSLGKPNRHNSKQNNTGGGFWKTPIKSNPNQPTSTTWIVWTPYGLAKLLSERKIDNIMILRTSWGATIYMNASKVVLLKEITKPILVPPPVDAIGQTQRRLSFPNAISSLLAKTPAQTNTASRSTGFWGRLFGYHPKSHDSGPQVAQSIPHTVGFPSAQIPENLIVIRSLFEYIERTLVQLQNTSIPDLIESIPPNLFSNQPESVELTTLYGKGTLLTLICRPEAILLKVRFSWGGIGYLALNVVQSLLISNTSTEENSGERKKDQFERLDQSRHVSTQYVNECLENVRKIRAALHGQP